MGWLYEVYYGWLSEISLTPLAEGEVELFIQTLPRYHIMEYNLCRFCKATFRFKMSIHNDMNAKYSPKCSIKS